jgi:hypothetical protein
MSNCAFTIYKFEYSTYLNASDPPPRISDPYVSSKELVQFFGFTFEDDTTFYRLNVDPNWQPEVHFEETTEPDLNEAITAIQSRVPGIQLTIIGVYDPDDDPSKLYYMLSLAASITGGSRRYCRESSWIG